MEEIKTETLTKVEKQALHAKEIKKLLEDQTKRRQQLKLEKTKRDEETKNPEEMIQVVEKVFSEHYNSLSAEIKTLQKLEVMQRDTLNVLWDSLADLRNYYTQVSFSLNTYNQWKFKKKITSLENSIQDLGKNIPRTKFRFKRRKKKVELVDEEARKKKELAQKLKHKEIIDTLQGISDKENEELVVTQAELESVSNFKLVNLKKCKIRFLGKVNSLFVRNVKDCHILTGPVVNSIMIHDAVDSTIAIIGHQIRIHDSVNTRFDVFTTSKLIIEGCKELKFSEWERGRDGYPGVEKDMRKVHFHGKENLWKDVQDFHWIKQEKSPNFSLIGVKVEEEVERKVVVQLVTPEPQMGEKTADGELKVKLTDDQKRVIIEATKLDLDIESTYGYERPKELPVKKEEPKPEPKPVEEVDDEDDDSSEDEI